MDDIQDNMPPPDADARFRRDIGLARDGSWLGNNAVLDDGEVYQPVAPAKPVTS